MCQILRKSALSRRILKKAQTQNLMKIRLVEAELFHEDRRRDRQTDGRADRYDEANSPFSQFCERT